MVLNAASFSSFVRSFNPSSIDSVLFSDIFCCCSGVTSSVVSGAVAASTASATTASFVVVLDSSLDGVTFPKINSSMSICTLSFTF